jgi:transcriptional regulator with XRE-family HTH domain
MKDRIIQIMKDKQLSPAQFADKLGVARSGLSHIISGRNKASLDFIEKMLEAFPDINTLWLIKGKNEAITPTLEMTKLQDSILKVNKRISMRKQSNKEEPVLIEVSKDNINEEIGATTLSIDNKIEEETNLMKRKNLKTIERIVFFYNDGSYKEYSNF